MKVSIVKGATSVILRIFIADSSSTTGAGLTGLVFNSAGLTCYRMRDDDGNAGGTAISLASATLGTWTSGGFKEKDATNCPGWYELHLTNATIATGSRTVGLHLKGATNMAPLPIEIELTGWDNQDGVRGGMTALPNAASGANGGLPLSVDASGRVDVLKINGTSQTARDIGASVLLSAGTGTGQLDFTSGVVKANATQWLGGTIPAVNVTGVPLVDLKYTLGTISPATAGSVRADSVTGAVGSVTGNVGGNVVGSTASVAGAVGSVTGDVGGKVLGGGAGTISGTGVRAVDSSGNAIAPASTALSTAQWTNTRAGYLDNLAAGLVALASGVALTSGERSTLAAAILDLTDGIETGITLRNMLRAGLAMLAGKSNGFPAGPYHFRDPADAKNRVTLTSDADGNRLTITFDFT